MGRNLRVELRDRSGTKRLRGTYPIPETDAAQTRRFRPIYAAYAGA